MLELILFAQSKACAFGFSFERVLWVAGYCRLLLEACVKKRLQLATAGRAVRGVNLAEKSVRIA